jgi:GNAT superfamily N-acetyltransferase
VRAHPASAADLPAIRAIARAHGDVFEEGKPDHVGHELEHGRLVVAEDQGVIVGYGGAFERAGVSYLADLFVEPDLLGQGAGTALMRELYPEPGERFTYASPDHRALSLYVRSGMRALTSLFYLRGDPAAAHRLPEPEVQLEPGSADAVLAFDASSFGRERPADLDFLVARGSERLVARSGRAIVGYGFVRVAPHRDGAAALLNPSGADTPENMVRTTFALIRHAAALAPQVYVALLGDFPALAEVLVAGFRIHDRDTYMASRPDLVDGTRYAPSPTIG